MERGGKKDSVGTGKWEIELILIFIYISQMPSHANEIYNQESENHSLVVTCSLQLLQFWNFAKFASCIGTGADEKTFAKQLIPSCSNPMVSQIMSKNNNLENGWK